MLAQLAFADHDCQNYCDFDTTYVLENDVKELWHCQLYKIFLILIFLKKIIVKYKISGQKTINMRPLPYWTPLDSVAILLLGFILIIPGFLYWDVLILILFC